MKVTCQGARAIVTELDVLASGAVNYFEATFTFDAVWDSFNYKYGVFKGSGRTELVQLTINTCKIPRNIIERSTDLFIGAIGMDADNMQQASVIFTTTMAFACKVPEGASTSAMIENEDQTLFQQVVQAALDIHQQLVWEPYDENKDYYIGNKVVYNGVSYYCKLSILGSVSTNPATDTNNWVAIVSAGSADALYGTYTKGTGDIPVAATDSIRIGTQKLEGQIQSVKDNINSIFIQQDIVNINNTFRWELIFINDIPVLKYTKIEE